jgi:hypothetical protein
VISLGTTRTVLCIGTLAFKLARCARGRGNRYERDLYARSGSDRRALLCPSLWCSPLGVVQIMRRARPMTADEHRKLVLDKYTDLGRAWDYRGPGGDEAPFEPKAREWGWLAGKVVAVDYANFDGEDEE